MKECEKVMDINVEGKNFICIFDRTVKRNPYRLFIRWFEDGSWHRKQLERYANFISVICRLQQYGFDNRWGYKD